MLKRAKQHGLSTSLDLGWTDFNKFREGLYEILQWVDYFFPNELEAKALTETADILSALNCLQEKVSLPLITMGKQGVIALQNGCHFFMPAFPVQSVDAIGSGDAFDAGFLWAVKSSKELSEVLRIAGACGALTVTGAGGGPSAPTREDLRSFLDAYPNILCNKRGLITNEF